MKIVRILWGDSDYVIGEIPDYPLFKDEVVFVWGRENNTILLDKGYKTILLGENHTHVEFDSSEKMFGHKLFALEKAEQEFHEYLFLDWDVIPIKKIDDDFFKLVRGGSDIKCPLYSFPKSYAKDQYFHLKRLGKIDENSKNFVINFNIGINTYSWKMEEDLILPCFCFFYSRRPGIVRDLLKIARSYKISYLTDEFSLFKYLEGSLDDYIYNYEPLVIRGKEKHRESESISFSFGRTNSYIENKIRKNIYLLHDFS